MIAKLIFICGCAVGMTAMVLDVLGEVVFLTETTSISEVDVDRITKAVC